MRVKDLDTYPNSNGCGVAIGGQSLRLVVGRPESSSCFILSGSDIGQIS